MLNPNAGVLYLAIASMASLGCSLSMSVPQGAGMAFEKSFMCPLDRISVTPRPDVPVHTLVGHGADGAAPRPPPDVAADPARLAIWQSQIGAKWAEVDQLGPPYQVDGCGKTAMMICYHPTTLDVVTNNGVTVGGGGMSISKNGAPATLLGYVQCQSGQLENKGKLGLATDGTTVADVRDGSPAALAGLQRGDVIVAIDRMPVADAAQMLAILKTESPAGHAVTVRRADGNHDLLLRP